MMGDLPSNVIGTSPKFSPIVDHSWLTVDPATYDNYPSDNNSVRVLPKLADLWNPEAKNSGLNLIPNMKVCPVMGSPAPMKSAAAVVMEAKKAMMSGAKGKDLADHLRSRFATKELVAASEEMQKLSSEQGLLGNVYIDASAFDSYEDAKQFMSRHRTRLARDMVVGNSNMTPEVVQVLASEFRKNIVADVSYDQKTFDHYKSHLVASGVIPKDFVIDSKETLRQAFLFKKAEEVAPAPKEEKKLDKQQALDAFTGMAAKNAQSRQTFQDEVDFGSVRSMVVYAREALSEGKEANDLKELLRSKYSAENIRTASKYLAIACSDARVASISDLITQNKIAESVGDEIRKIAKKYPIKKATFEEPVVQRTGGAQGYYHSMNTPQTVLPAVKNAVDALRSGYSVEDVRKAVRSKAASGAITMDVAESIVASAVQEFNATGSGIKANEAKKSEKPKLVEDPEPAQTLPDASTIQAKAQEYSDMFAGSNDVIDINPSRKQASAFNIGDLFNRSGMDSHL